jgi:hypothetical protein
VTLEAVNFEVGADRKITRSQLDPHMHVKFSQSGVRIGPKDSTHVFFDASAESYPAWFMIYATFRRAEPQPGVNLAMQLGHPVYMYQKEAIAKDEVTLQKISFDPASHKLSISVENHGDKLARPYVSFPQLHDDQYRMRLYPVFPRTTTTTSFDLTEDGVLKNVLLSSVVVEFDHFKLPGSVSVVKEQPISQPANQTPPQ